MTKTDEEQRLKAEMNRLTDIISRSQTSLDKARRQRCRVLRKLMKLYGFEPKKIRSETNDGQEE